MKELADELQFTEMTVSKHSHVMGKIKKGRKIDATQIVPSCHFESFKHRGFFNCKANKKQFYVAMKSGYIIRIRNAKIQG